MHILVDKHRLYKNQKGYLSQNILIVYDFNIKFIYELARWDKLAHNERIWSDVIETKEFKIFIGKYCLEDAGYSNLDYFLVSDKKVWYYLNEQKLVLQKPVNAKKLFNVYYSCLCNVIEQIFEIV